MQPKERPIILQISKDYVILEIKSHSIFLS